MSIRERKRSIGEKETDVEQLFHAIARRDPSKRQIKPVSTTVQLELFDELDDDSDSEFVCEDREDEDDSEVEDSDTQSGSKSSSDESDSSSSVDVGESTVIQPLVADENVSLQVNKEETPNVEPFHSQKAAEENGSSVLVDLQTGNAKVANMTNVVQPVVRGSTVNPEKRPADFLVCMVCLGDSNDPNDELIECDGCGIVVHEDCYKVVDSIFMSSGASSSSTDAWFCEPCLAGIKTPYCELCPNLYGAFKRTDNNRWVHLICALYTPGVAFNEPEDLMGVTLTELPPKGWASRECSLCDERFFAWTGVCIGCDAGLCRTYFHCTCAQKHGLLSEPVMDENAADPYFAHCRQHTDKAVARQRRRNYLTAMSRWRWKRKQITETAANTSPGFLHSPDLHHTLLPFNEVMLQLEPRLQRKLEQFRALYEELLKVRDKPYVPTTKIPLFIEHSPVAMRQFVLKAKRLQLPLELTGQSAISDSSKAPPSGYPVFSPDFISYFFEREKRIAEVMKRISVLQNTQRELQISDASASHSYNSISSQLDSLIARRNELRSQFHRIMSCLHQLVPEIKPSPLLEPVLEELRSNAEVKHEVEHSTSDEQDKQSTRFGRVTVGRKAMHAIDSRADSHRGIKRRGTALSPTPTKHGMFMDKERIASRTAGAVAESVILECFVCHGLQDQHLITKCDTCSKAFHLVCLDPPLLRMPKRSRLYGWQCSFCTKAVASNSEVIQVDLNAPRQLRRSWAGSGVGRFSGGGTECIEEVHPKVVSPTKPEDSMTSSEQTSSVPPKPEPANTESTAAFPEPTTPAVKRRRGSAGARLSLTSRRGSRTTNTFGVSARGAARVGRGRGKRSLGTQRYTPTPTKRTPRRSAPSIFKSRSEEATLPVQPTILITQIDSTQCTTSTTPESTSVTSKSFDAYEYHAEANSDEEITRLRSSKVIKFEQIRDHSRNSDSESVEQIAPLNLRYVICRDNGGAYQKKPASERFRVKLKKV